MPTRNPSTSSSFAARMMARFSLSVFLLSAAPSLLLAQTEAINPEVQALREEVMELKARLAGLESKLEAFALATAPAANRIAAAVPVHARLDVWFLILPGILRLKEPGRAGF
jgi:hypothetical protein